MAPRGELAREEGAKEGAVYGEQERKELNGSIPPPPEFSPPPPQPRARDLIPPGPPHPARASASRGKTLPRLSPHLSPVELSPLAGRKKN